MDGSLLDLTAEMLESELEDYWHELFKVQKLMVTKLRKAKADSMMARRRSRIVSDPKLEAPAAAPALDSLNSSVNIPLPTNAENTLKLITSIQNRMKEFKAS